MNAILRAVSSDDNSASDDVLRLASSDYALVQSIKDADNADSNAKELASASAFSAYAADVYTLSCEIAQAQIDKEDSDAKRLGNAVRPLALAITYASDNDTKIAKAVEFFKIYRGPYAVAKQAFKDDKRDVDKKTLKRISRAFNLAKKQATRVFDSEGFVIYWPALDTGKGRVEIRTKVQDTKERAKDAAEQALTDARDAQGAQRAKDVAELNAVRRLTPNQLAQFVYRLIVENGADVDTTLANVAELANSANDANSASANNANDAK